MKRITMIIAAACLALVAICAINLTKPEVAAASTTTRWMKPAQVGYLDLTHDMCDPNGLSSAQRSALLSSGYINVTLAQDAYFEGVQFKNSAGYYTQNGWVKAGTELFYNPIDPNHGGTFAVCSNVYTYWRWQV